MLDAGSALQLTDQEVVSCGRAAAVAAPGTAVGASDTAACSAAFLTNHDKHSWLTTLSLLWGLIIARQRQVDHRRSSKGRQESASFPRQLASS